MDTSEPRHLGWGLGGKDFAFADLHFTLHGAVQDVTGMSAWLCLLFLSGRPAVSLSAHSNSSWNLEGGGVGLTCFSFFFQTTQNAVVLTSGLSVLLASTNAVLVCSRCW